MENTFLWTALRYLLEPVDLNRHLRDYFSIDLVLQNGMLVSILGLVLAKVLQANWITFHPIKAGNRCHHFTFLDTLLVKVFSSLVGIGYYIKIFRFVPPFVFNMNLYGNLLFGLGPIQFASSFEIDVDLATNCAVGDLLVEKSHLHHFEYFKFHSLDFKFLVFLLVLEEIISCGCSLITNHRVYLLNLFDLLGTSLR